MESGLLVKKIIAIILMLGICFALVMTIKGNAYSSMVSLVGLETMGNPLFCIGAPLLLSCVTGLTFYQLLRNRIFLPLIKVEAVAYSLLFFAVVMLKSRGIQAIHLDITDIYQSLVQYPESVILNILLFVPVGAVVYRYCKSLPIGFAIALVFVVAIEALQYLLRLGISDVVDVATGVLGFALGYLLLYILQGAGLRLVHISQHHVAVTRT